MARPRVEINVEDFKKLCSMFATLEDIAGWFNCSTDTVERWCQRELKCSFADAYKKYSAIGRNSLRATLFQHAKKSYPAAIFLAKNYLGMKDNPREIMIAAKNGKLEDLIAGLMEPVEEEES